MVNYWEIRPSGMAAKLDELLSAGVTHIATFVPWQALEADISHQFTRLLQAVTERKMALSLIVTPEVGVHYGYSGLPKDIVSRADCSVVHCQRGPVAVHLPPNGFNLPSILAPDFTKRYYSFLSRVDHLLAEFERSQNEPLHHITVVLTGSYWKYYRSPALAARGPFDGPAGDYSPAASIQYRQRLEDFYAQAEFNDPTPMAANRWKTHQMESVNHRWFYQQSEAVFRNRTIQYVRKKAPTVRVQEFELFTPEADPSLSYQYFLQTVSGRDMDLFKLSSLIDEAASISSMAALSPAIPFIHWSALGGFHNLSDQEKQFLILKSLLLIGGDGGGLLIDEEEWFSLSKSFRSRAEALARSISQGDLRVRTAALYLCPHLWSGPGALWPEFSKRGGVGVKRVASLDWAVREPDANLLFVDPSVVVTRDVLHRLTQWAKGGKILVMPRGTLYTESARAQLELLAAAPKRIEMNLGVSYRIHPLGDGKLVIYDLPESAQLQQQAAPEWQNFLGAILSLADVQARCQVSDSRICMIPLERRDRSIGLFVLNGSLRQVAADLIFPVAVTVSDLAVEVSATKRAGSTGQNAPAGEQDRPGEPVAAKTQARRFSLDVPPCGVLPLAIDRVGFTASHEEQVAADRLGELGAENVLKAAAHELPGLRMNEESPWN